MQWGQCKSSKLSFILKEQSTSSAHILSDICSCDEETIPNALQGEFLSKMDICEINRVNFGCNNCDHAGFAVKCIQLQQLKKQLWSCSWLNFSALLFQLLELNTFNCEDYYFRIFTDKVGENRSKQCCIAGCQNEAGMHSVTYLQRRYEITPERLINHGWSLCATVILKCFQKINDWHSCPWICHQ